MGMLSVSESNRRCHKCGCTTVFQQKQIITSDRLTRIDSITELWLVCVKCKSRRIKQKIRLYNSEEVLTNAKISEEELEALKSAPDDRVSLTHRH